MYRNGDSNVKSLLRTILAKKLPLELKHVIVLSLPANNFLFEKLLEDLYPDKTFNFICLEKDKQVYQSGIEILESGFLRSTVEYLNQTTSEYFNNSLKKPTFDLVWLDYCGQMCPYMMQDFEDVAELIHEKSVVAITLMGKRERKTTMDEFRDLVPQSMDISNQEIREELFSASIQYILEIKTESVYRYIDSSDRKIVSPMYLYIFKNHNTDKKKVYYMSLDSRIENIDKYNVRT